MLYLEQFSLLVPQDNYLDAYLRVIKDTDPLRTALIFNCGMGAVRTTFAMVAMSLVRRKQLIARGMEDPFASKSLLGVCTTDSYSLFFNSFFVRLRSRIWCVLYRIWGILLTVPG